MEILRVAKPFLRWAGGKRWLLKSMERYLPNRFENYYEPFLGGGAVFFHLRPQKKVYLSDLNEGLIKTYSQLQSDVEGVIKFLSTLENTEEMYYEIRKRKYKSLNRQAARFIYLNQMSYNGIYRVNSSGEYNVPYGKRASYQFDYLNLRRVSEALSNVDLRALDFEDALSGVGAGDLVFLDPPYTVTHNTNGFIQYNQMLFSKDAQIRLASVVQSLHEKKVNFILTNAAHPFIKEVFSNRGGEMEELFRSSTIGGVGAQRGKYEELVIFNGGREKL